MLIRKANEKDRAVILAIMKHWNMHRVPSEEMPELDISSFFVAIINHKVVGASGYKLISETQGKTTLLGVEPDHLGKSIGYELQKARLKAMYDLGAKTVITNADRPATIRWYKKHFGYFEIGKIKKVHSFGREDIDEWTTLKMDLKKYYDV